MEESGECSAGASSGWNKELFMLSFIFKSVERDTADVLLGIKSFVSRRISVILHIASSTGAFESVMLLATQEEFAGMRCSSYNNDILRLCLSLAWVPVCLLAELKHEMQKSMLRSISSQDWAVAQFFVTGVPLSQNGCWQSMQHSVSSHLGGHHMRQPFCRGRSKDSHCRARGLQRCKGIEIPLLGTAHPFLLVLHQLGGGEGHWALTSTTVSWHLL